MRSFFLQSEVKERDQRQEDACKPTSSEIRTLLSSIDEFIQLKQMKNVVLMIENEDFGIPRQSLQVHNPYTGPKRTLTSLGMQHCSINHKT
jgi:hypothetical protein